MIPSSNTPSPGFVVRVCHGVCVCVCVRERERERTKERERRGGGEEREILNLSSYQYYVIDV